MTLMFREVEKKNLPKVTQSRSNYAVGAAEKKKGRVTRGKRCLMQSFDDLHWNDVMTSWGKIAQKI